MTRIVFIALALVAIVVAAVVWSGAGGVEEPADFRFINRGEIKTLDPNRISWMQDVRMGLALWEGLYQLDPKTADAIPGTAGKIDISDDQLVYTFHIRPEARWSNPEADPVRAQDFVFAWRRMLEYPGDYTYLFFYIKGAREYSEAFGKKETTDFATVGIEALDDKTLRVTLSHPVPFFPDLCAFPSFFPLHEASMLPFLDPSTGTYRKEFTKPPHLVTNGPYRMHAWQFKRRLRLVANDNYWDRANVKCRIIDQISAEDAAVQYNMFQTGAVDWLADVNSEFGSAMRDRQDKSLHVFPGFGTYFYSFNCLPKLPDGRDNPFADVKVRRALTMAIDKKPIVENVSRMGEEIATTYVPPHGFPTYPSPAGIKHDPEAAKRLLAEAGFPGGKGFPKVTLLFNTGSHHDQVAQIIRRQWQEVLGIDVDLEGVEVKIFGERLHNQQYAVARASWIGDYGDVSTFTDKYLSVSENNDCKWVSKPYDDLCAQAAIEPDPTKRLKLLAAAEKILLDEAPIIPIYFYVNYYLLKDNIQGLYENPRNMQNFKAIEVVGE